MIHARRPATSTSFLAGLPTGRHPWHRLAPMAALALLGPGLTAPAAFGSGQGTVCVVLCAPAGQREVVSDLPGCAECEALMEQICGLEDPQVARCAATGQDSSGEAEDPDGDGVPGAPGTAGQDNCPQIANPSQGDTDRNGAGDACDPDDDGDGLDDRFELDNGLNPRSRDTDGDGLSDDRELEIGTDPLSRDTDGDGIPDRFDPHPLDPEAEDDSHAIYLKSEARVPAPGLDPALALNTLARPHVFVQLWREPDQATRADLEALYGLRLLHYIPRNLYHARLAAARFGEVAADPRVRWLGPVRPRDRVDPRLLNLGMPEELRGPDGSFALDVTFMPDVSDTEATGVLLRLGAAQIEASALPGLYSTRFPDGSLPRVAAEDTILFAEPGAALVADHEIEQRRQMNVDDPNGATVVSYTGTGVTVAQIELKVPDEDHPALTGDVHINPTLYFTGDHATHVAGIITADAGYGDWRDRGVGIAPDAYIEAYDAPSGGRNAYNKLDKAFDDGADIVTNSWGYTTQEAGSYKSTSQAYDYHVQGDAPGTRMIIVHSAGNSRGGGKPKCDSSTRGGDWDCIGVPATAKNSITVGAVEGGTLCDGGYSSAGPTNDGRIKPDVVAPGDLVFSTIEAGAVCPDQASNNAITDRCALDLSFDCDTKADCEAHSGVSWDSCLDIAGNCQGYAASDTTCGARECGVETTACNTFEYDDYGIKTGTSMAAPAVAGAAALILEAWRNLGLSGLHSDPLPSTVKALLIHTATDLDNDGAAGTASPTDGPSYLNGWGLVNVGAAIDLLQSHAGEAVVHESDGLDSAGDEETYEFAIQEDDVGSSFEVTLVWDDIPANPGASSTLWNNFDLEVESPDGWIYYPWRLKASTPGRDPHCYVDDGNGVVDGLPNLSPCTELDAVSSSVPNPTDRTNNVEVVLVPYVESLQVGTWIARVTATSMPSASGFDPTYSLILPFDHDVECGDILTADTKLFEDLECSGGTAVTMGADGLTLDCDAYAIRGDGSGIGVDLGGTSGVTVQNCAIEDFSYGISAAGAEDCSIVVNELSGSFVNLYMKGADSCSVGGNAIGAASDHGIYLSGTDNLLYSNEMEENETAIVILAGSSGTSAYSSSNTLNLNVVGNGVDGAVIYGESTVLGANSICYPDETGLTLASTAADTLVTGNIFCHAGDYDIRLSDFVSDPNDVRDPASDSNVCSDYNTNSFGAFWADASVAAGCTIGCSTLTCEPVTVPPELDDGWDGLDVTGEGGAIIEIVLTGDIVLGNGLVSFGPAAGVTPTPGGRGILLRRVWSDDQLGSHRRTGMRLFRREIAGNVWMPAPRSGSASTRNALSAAVDRPGVFLAFGPLCDVEIPGGSSTLTPVSGGDIQPGETVCLEPGGVYDGAAMELDVDDVTLDCRGATLTGTGTCLRVHDARDVEVMGCRFESCGIALRALNAPGVRLRLNEILDGEDGFEVIGSPGAIVEGNTACGQTGSSFTVDSRPELALNACDQGCDVACQQ